MLEGVRILIARMGSNPEEFVYDNTTTHLGRTPKFYHITDQINKILQGDTSYNLFSHLTAEEKTALLVAFRKMMRQAFTAQVIATTFNREEDGEAERAYIKTQPYRGLIGKAQPKMEGSNIAFYGSNGVEINPWK